MLEKKTRKPFRKSTKKIEWNRAAGRKDDDFKTTSKCRVRGELLRWEERTYDFDHRDNNPANNSQSNCYLLCKTCHGKYTITKKRRRGGILGGYQTIKLKRGYKKPKKSTKTKRVAIRNLFGQVIGYKTVKVSKRKSKKKKIRKRKKTHSSDFSHLI